VSRQPAPTLAFIDVVTRTRSTWSFVFVAEVTCSIRAGKKRARNQALFFAFPSLLFGER
jgi:hypothetical protein